jgi:hypothetical protein
MDKHTIVLVYRPEGEMDDPTTHEASPFNGIEVYKVMDGELPGNSRVFLEIRKAEREHPGWRFFVASGLAV